MVENTFGVGPAVAGKNVGPDNSTVSRLAQYGKVYDKNGDLVFDPTVNLIEQIDPEGGGDELTTTLYGYGAPVSGKFAMTADFEGNADHLAALNSVAEWAKASSTIASTDVLEDTPEPGMQTTLNTYTAVTGDLYIHIDEDFVASPPQGTPLEEYNDSSATIHLLEYVVEDESFYEVHIESTLNAYPTSASGVPVTTASWNLDNTYLTFTTDGLVLTVFGNAHA